MSKKKWLVPVLSVLGAVLVLGGAGFGYLHSQYSSDKFLRETYINGYEVSGMTAAEASKTIRQQYDEEQVSLYEKDVLQQSGTLKDYGYNLSEERAEALVAKAMSLQKESYETVFRALTGKSRYQMALPVSFDEAQFQQMVKAESLATPRAARKNAELTFDNEAKQYTIVPETYGTELNDSDLQNFLKTAIDEYTSNPDEKKDSELKVTIPEELYLKPEILSDNRDMVNKQNVWNQYCKTKINYTFGSEIETLDWSIIQNWLQVKEDGTGVLLEEPIRAWLKAFANRRDTRYYNRDFSTSVGRVVSFSGGANEYGYTTNESAEYERLLQEIPANEEVTREPIYYTTNDYGNPVFHSRNGQDDLNGTYVEVNLSMQHLWFYKNGALVVESDIVSGSVAKNAETQTGVFPLAYKESPSILVGSNANDGYRTEVQYWMPFYEGQGLHDATWRSSFGGSIYQSNGSHGCVNLPYSVAQTIYNNIESGTAIVIYK